MEFTVLSRLNSQVPERIDGNKQHERMHFLHRGHWRMNIYPCGLQQCRKMLVKLSKVFKALSIGIKKKIPEQIQPTYERDIYYPILITALLKNTFSMKLLLFLLLLLLKMIWRLIELFLIRIKLSFLIWRRILNKS